MVVNFIVFILFHYPYHNSYLLVILAVNCLNNISKPYESEQWMFVFNKSFTYKTGNKIKRYKK